MRALCNRLRDGSGERAAFVEPFALNWLQRLSGTLTIRLTAATLSIPHQPTQPQSFDDATKIRRL